VGPRAGRVNAAEQREERRCNGVWAAAGDGQQRRMSKQAVTGRCAGEYLLDLPAACAVWRPDAVRCLGTLSAKRLAYNVQRLAHQVTAT
jgi:hypothetical protein